MHLPKFEYINTTYHKLPQLRNGSLEIAAVPTGWRKHVFNVLRKAMVRLCGVRIQDSYEWVTVPKATIVETSKITEVIANQVKRIIECNDTPGLAIVGYKALELIESTTHFTGVSIKMPYEQRVEHTTFGRQHVMVVLDYEIPVILTDQIESVIVFPQRGINSELKTRTFFHHMEYVMRSKHTCVQEVNDTRLALLEFLTDVLHLSPKLKNAVTQLIHLDIEGKLN